MFVKVIEDSSVRTDHQLNTLYMQQKDRRKSSSKTLRSITETVILCGRQDIAFQGHCKDRSSLEENPTSNHGNFLTLLRFHIQVGDEVFSDHLQSAPANATYVATPVKPFIMSLLYCYLL